MKRKFTFLLTMSFIVFGPISSNYAMGPKDNPAQKEETNKESESKKDSTSQGKDKLAKEFIEISGAMRFPELSNLLKPLESEFEALGLPKQPFEKTLKLASEQLNIILAPILNIIKEPFEKTLMDRFSEAELKELVEIYKKPVMKKTTDFMYNWFLDPLLLTLKDQKVLQDYIGKFTGLTIASAIQLNPQELNRKTQELMKTAQDELEKLKAAAKIDSPEFKEKLKKRYQSVANIIDTINFGTLFEDIKKGLEKPQEFQVPTMPPLPQTPQTPPIVSGITEPNQ